jgi:mRNA-degrading endonuclease toxin of MazEF toxin-antitoxin module
MNANTFDIFFWQPTGWPEPHPCVIVSHPARAQRKDWVEVVVCSTKRAGRRAEDHEFILDEEDGLDWPTLCKCDLIFAVPREHLKSRKGRVCAARQVLLVRTLIAAHGWATVI